MKTLNLLTLLVAFVFISCKDKHEFGDLTPPVDSDRSSFDDAYKGKCGHEV